MSIEHESVPNEALGPSSVQPPDDLTAANQGAALNFINNLDVDSQDSDSSLGTDFNSSTQSLRPSVYDYVEENGRRYHKFKEGSKNTFYQMMRVNKIDSVRFLQATSQVAQLVKQVIDLQHQLSIMAFDGKLHLAPLEDLKSGIHDVLDIGTGTGIWAIDFANQYPSAAVIGTDLSPIQPEFVPPNLTFEVDDAEDPWIFKHQFDYIHGRFLASCFTSHRNVFSSAFAALRPGGFLELQDSAPFECIDDSIHGTAFERWQNTSLAGVARLGRDFNQTPRYKQYLEEIGFVDVVEQRFAWPVGTWARGVDMKTLGAWAREDFLSGIQGWSVAILTRAMGMSQEAVELLLMDVRKEIMGKKLHIYMPIWVVYGRKPEA